MTQPDPKDTTAVGGAHPGTMSQPELENKISFNIKSTDKIGDTASRILNSAEWHMNTLADTIASANYPVDPSVSYYGAGALSLLPQLGKFIFASNINEANRGAFTLDQSESSFYSSMNSTTLGSLSIDTVDGYVLNPVSPTFPSTNYSPTKPWIKQIFPNISLRNLVTISVLELVQAALLKIIDDNKSSEKIESKQDVDFATILIDNQEVEDKILGKI